VNEVIRVLIVDDNPEVRQGLATMLNLAARNIIPSIELVGEAQNGDEAITQARLFNPDVILMDLEMPVMNGFEATRCIKTDQPEVRVIILSIHASPKEHELAREAGADGFLTKGCDHTVLMNAIISTKNSITSDNQKKESNNEY
jgi:DNA-binding NarL/FixJ family response regulator